MNQNRGKFRKKREKKMFELMIDGDVGKVKVYVHHNTGGYFLCLNLPVFERNFCLSQGTYQSFLTCRVAQVPRV